MDQLLDQLLEHVRGIWQRRFWGLGVAWLVATVGLAVVLSIPPKYEASARVFVNTESVLKPLMAGLAVQPDFDQQIKILSSTLLSRPNVETLIQLADLGGDAKTERERSALIGKVTQAVNLSGSRDNVFWLSYQDSDRERAKRVVESLLSVFVDSGLSSKRRDTGKAMQFLDAQIGEYEKVLADAEQRLKRFKLQNLDQLASSQDAVGSMMALDGEIERARTDLQAVQQRRDALRARLASEDSSLHSDSAGSSGRGSASTDGLAEVDARADLLRRNLDELLRKYTEDHPDVVGTKRILENLEQQREAILQARRRAGPDAQSTGNQRREPNPVYQQLKLSLADAEGDVAAASARLAGLESRYNRIRATAKLRPEFEEELAQLNREYQVQKANYEQLVQRREQAKLTGQLDESGGVDFRIIDPPRVSSTPVSPNRLQLVLALLVIALGAGLAASFVASRTFPTVSTVKELRALAAIPVLGAVSFVHTPETLRREKRRSHLFAGGVTGLCALFGIALAAVVIMGRMG